MTGDPDNVVGSLLHSDELIRTTGRTFVHVALMPAMLAAVAGCQPRAAVSPAPPTPEVQEQPAPALEKQPSPTARITSPSIPWPPPPPPLPSKSAARAAASPQPSLSDSRPTTPAPAPTGDPTASSEGTAMASAPEPPAPQPADEIAVPAKVDGAATLSASEPPAPQPADDIDTSAPGDGAAAISTPATSAPKPADDIELMAKRRGSTATPRPTPRAPEPEPTAAAVRQKPSWKNVRGATPVADQNIFYDEENTGYQTLQKANEALKGFPLVKKQGELDWGEALTSGLIQPRASLSDQGEMMVLDLDIVMKDTKTTPYVRFSHKTHTQWLECSNCHQQIFKPLTGANPISMTAILEGQYCGVCHNKVAFATRDCERCHNVPVKK